MSSRSSVVRILVIFKILQRARKDSENALNPTIAPSVPESRTSSSSSIAPVAHAQPTTTSDQTPPVVRPDSPVVVRKRMRMFHNPYYKPPVVSPGPPEEKVENHPILPASIRPSTSYSLFNKVIIPRTRSKKLAKIEMDPNPHTSLMLMILQMLTKDRPSKGHV